MFIKTIKVKKPTTALTAIIFAVTAIIAIVAIITHKLGSPAVYELKTENARQDFMQEMGWNVSEEYDQCKVVVIPDEFNDVYNKYNDLQREQGFDLRKYKGKTVEIYTYSVYNYDNYENKDCIKCHLMICDGILIGGDVSSTEIDGFMQGLRKN